MRFFSLFLSTCLMCSGAWAAPKRHHPPPPSTMIPGTNTPVSPDVEDVLSAFKGLDSRIVALNNRISKLNSKKNLFVVVNQLMHIAGSSNMLKKAMNNAMKALKKSKPFSKQESELVIQQMIEAGPHSQAMMENLKAKKHDFDTAIFGAGSLSHSIARAMRKTQGSAQQLQKALMAKLDKEFEPMGPIMLDHINKTYDDLVAFFEVSGGRFDVPDVMAIKDFFVERLKAPFAKHPKEFTVCHGEDMKDCVTFDKKMKFDKYMRKWRIKHPMDWEDHKYVVKVVTLS